MSNEKKNGSIHDKLKEKKNLFIIDAFGLVFRSYYALMQNNFQNSKGMPTSVLFGFTKTILKLIKDFNPDYLAIALESKVKTFRHDLFTEYKANRLSPPEDLKIQIPPLIEILNAFKLPNIEIEKLEADDVIASICEKYRKNDEINVYIVSNDKDLLQLVSDNIYAIRFMKGMANLELVDREKVKEIMGIFPETIRDYLALTGDSSDNIPGVKGIGEKTALKLLSQFGNLKTLYEQVERVTPQGIKTKLKNDKEKAFLSYELVKLHIDKDYNFDLTTLKNNGLKTNEGISLLKEYELYSLLQDEYFIKEYNNLESTSQIVEEKSQIQRTYKCITTKEDFENLLKSLREQEIFCIDLETDSDDPIKAEIVGISFSYEEYKAFYIPVKHLDSFGSPIEQLDYNFVRDSLKVILEDEKIKKIAQNAKYEYIILKKRWGVNLNPISFDPMLASYILNPERKSHGMDHLANELLNHETIKYSDIVPKGKLISEIDIETVTEYACEDSDITLSLYHVLKEELKKFNLEKLYYDIDLPLIKVLGDMEIDGVKINSDYFKKLSDEINKELIELQKNIWDESGLQFNINSTKQLQEILFEKLNLPSSKKTKTGYSTDVSVLEELALIHEVPRMLLQFRQLSKLNSTYLEALPKLINPYDKRIHTSFNQTVVTTGRLSSTNPNLQNIPIKGEWGRKIRKGFIAENDNYIISADYSQIELRILAHLSEDEQLLKAYNENMDLHSQTAVLLFGLDGIDSVTEEQRRAAKTINFSVIYGVGAFTLAKRLNISRNSASTFINDYFALYKRVSDFFERQKEEASKNGFVTTLFGRKRYIKEINSKNKNIKAAGERLAINTPIQGTSADIIKIAMNNISNEIKKRNLKSRMTIQVHDELVFEVIKEELDEMKSLVQEKMSRAADLKVALKVDINHGINWGEAH